MATKTTAKKTTRRREAAPKKAAPKAPSAQDLASQIPDLSAEDEIKALRAAHDFFGSYSNVPGFAASAWGNALDNIAHVANSLIKKAGLLDDVVEPPEDPKAPTE